MKEDQGEFRHPRIKRPDDAKLEQECVWGSLVKLCVSPANISLPQCVRRMPVTGKAPFFGY